MKRFYWILCVLFAYCAKAQNANCATNRYQQKVFSQVTKTSQILFGTADPYGVNTQMQDLYLDFYEPSGDSLQERPLIVFAFGGAFLIGDKNQPPIPRYCEEFAKMGYAVAAIDYRIGFNLASTESAIRAVYRAAQDLRAAVRFFCQRAAQYKIDTTSIILTGSSAGCFAGLHSTYFEENQRPQATFGIPLENTDLGCFDCSGNADFGKRLPKIAGIVNHWGALLDTLLIENEPDENCPVISFHGTNDLAVPYTYGNPFSYPVFPNVHGSKNIHSRLNSLGIPNKLYSLNGEGHEPWLAKPELVDTMVKNTAPFLYNEVLRPKFQKITGDTIACKGQTINLQAISRARSSYCWSVSPKGSILQLAGNVAAVKCLDTGWVSVKVVEKNYLNAISNEVEFKLRVIEKPKANFNVQVSNQLAITITNNAQNYNNVFWDMGNGQTLNGALSNYSYVQPGSYKVLQTVSNIACSDTFSKIVAVDTCPTSHFTYKISGDSLFLFADSSNANSFFWNVNGTNFVGQNAMVILFANGTFPVRLTVANALGCSASSIQFITKEIASVAANSLNFVEVFPNPFKDVLNIVMPNEGVAKFSITNLLGATVAAGEVNGTITIDLPATLASAFLLLKVELPNGEEKMWKLMQLK